MKNKLFWIFVVVVAVLFSIIALFAAARNSSKCCDACCCFTGAAGQNAETTTGPTGATGATGSVNATGPAGNYISFLAAAANQSDQDAVWNASSGFIRFSITGGFVPTDSSIELFTFGSGSPTGDYIRVNVTGLYRVSIHLMLDAQFNRQETYLVRNSMNSAFAGNPNVVPWLSSIFTSGFASATDATGYVQLNGGDELRWSIETVYENSTALLDVPFPGVLQNNSWITLKRVA